MLNEDKKRLMSYVEEKKKILPWYISEFLEHKDSSNMSPSTLASYARDYDSFLNWLIMEGFTPGPISNVPLDVLEKLRVINIDTFKNHCKHQLDNEPDTIARKLSALKSLFYWLSNIAEDENYNPYLVRNVMAKVTIEKKKESASKRADNIQGKILLGNEFSMFRKFIFEGYGYKISSQTRLYNAWLHNRERDLAIVSLILGSGLRISEALSINYNDINWERQTISVIRKGNSEDAVPFSEIAAEDLLNYLAVRDTKYKVPKTERALFLSQPTGKGGESKRLMVRSFQKRFEVYAEAFGRKLSPHKLRHSFATEHFKKNGNLPLLQEVLNHSNINTTTMYNHLSNEERRESVINTDK